MIYEHIDKLIMQGLKDSQWANVTPGQTISKAPALGRVEKSTNMADLVEVAATHTRVINQQNVEKSEEVGNNQRKPSTAPHEPSTQNLPAVTARNTENIPEKATEMHDNYRHNDVPPELRTIIQSEERRAAMMAANLKICTAAINEVQVALTTAEMDSNKEFAQGLLTYFRATFAQFIANVSGSTLPVVPTDLYPVRKLSFKKSFSCHQAKFIRQSK